MIKIILNDEQTKAVRNAPEGVEVRDLRGRLVGYISPPPSDVDIAAAKERFQSSGPWYTTPQVLDHLSSLEQG